MTDVKSQESEDCSSGVPGRNEDSAQGGKEASKRRKREEGSTIFSCALLFIFGGRFVSSYTL